MQPTSGADETDQIDYRPLLHRLARRPPTPVKSAGESNQSNGIDDLQGVALPDKAQQIIGDLGGCHVTKPFGDIDVGHRTEESDSVNRRRW
jgi:hypothetical protein